MLYQAKEKIHMNISYEYYRIFYYVAKYENLTRAAAELMSSQPNVTRAMKNLEGELGCTLFIRSNRGIKLTPEGEKLYAHISIAESHIRMGEEELSMSKELQSGSISIGASEVALRCFLLPVLKSFKEKYPHIRLCLSNHSTPQAISALRSLQADIAFVTTPLGDASGLSVKPVKEIKEVAVCASSFPCDTKKAISLKELSELPLISLGSETRTHHMYSHWFSAHGLDFVPDIEASTADQILPLVENGLGIGFVPEDFLASLNTGDIIRLRLKEPVPPRQICLVKRTGQALSIAAGALEKMILEY